MQWRCTSHGRGVMRNESAEACRVGVTRDENGFFRYVNYDPTRSGFKGGLLCVQENIWYWGFPCAHISVIHSFIQDCWEFPCVHISVIHSFIQDY